MAAEVDSGAMDIISLIPDEIRTHVLIHLSQRELCDLCLVSRSWEELVSESGVWLELCKRERYIVERSDQDTNGRYYKLLYARLYKRLERLESSLVPVKITSSVKRFRGVSYSDGKITTIGENGKVQRWCSNSGERLNTFYIRTDPTGFKVKDDVIVLGYEDGPIQSWDMTSGRLLREYTGHEGRVEGIDINIKYDRILFASEDRHIRLWSLCKGTLLHTFRDTKTDSIFLGAGLYFRSASDGGVTAGEDVYYILWATSHQLNATKLSVNGDEVLGLESIELKSRVEYSQGLKVINNFLCSLICLQDQPNHFLFKRLCFDFDGAGRSRCFEGDEERYWCGHKSYISSFSCGATYQACFPLTLDRERVAPTGLVPPLYDTIHIYKLKRPLGVTPGEESMQLMASLQVKEFIHKKRDNLMEKVKRLASKGSSSNTSTRSRVTFTELADLGDMKWLNGLNGTNDTGTFLITVEYWEESRKFHLFVYNWSDPYEI